MTAPTPATPAAPAQEPTAPVAPAASATSTATPAPWTAETFDPERAWNLVENLRAEKAQLAQRPVITDEQRQQLAEYNRLVEASQTEAQRQQAALETATRTAEQAQADVVRYKVAATYGVPAEDFDLLGSGTEEEVTARAQRIAAKNAAAQAAAAQTPPVTPPVTRPVEQLRPGATPTGAASEDDAVMAALFGPPQ